MKPMGYDNTERVCELSRAGRLLKTRGGKMTINPMALSMLLYMAAKTYDWPPKGKVEQLNLPCRVYERGWACMAEDFGMTLVGADELMRDGADSDAIMNARRTTAINRLSQTAKFLQEQNLIRLLRPANLRREKPAAWLLLLGDDEENQAAERWARECLNLDRADA